MNDSKKEKLIRKIRGLLELSQDESSVNEAETAAKMAQRLIMKYNIEEAELHGEEHDALENYLFELYKYQKGNEGTWDRGLFNTIATFNFCKVIITQKWIDGKSRECLYILGSPTNIEMVEYITLQLMHRIRQIEKRHWAEYQGYDKRNTFRRGFFKGVVSGIWHQLEEQQEEFKEEAPESSNKIILAKDEQLQNFVDQEFGDLRKGRRTTSSSRDGQARGYREGKNMSINSGINGRGSSKQLAGN